MTYLAVDLYDAPGIAGPGWTVGPPGHSQSVRERLEGGGRTSCEGRAALYRQSRAKDVKR